jgi:protein ImuB
MFACLYSLSRPLASLVAIARDFTPRFEVVGPLVLLDISGLSRLFGAPHEIAAHLRRAAQGAPVRIALAPTQTAAALIVLGRPGVVVVEPGEPRPPGSEPGQPGRSATSLSVAQALAPLALGVLGDFARLHLNPAAEAPPPAPLASPASTPLPPHVGSMWDALPYFQSSLDRTSEAAAAPYRGTAHSAPDDRRLSADERRPATEDRSTSGTQRPPGGGWMHPRDAHAAASTRRGRRGVTRGTEHVHAALPAPGAGQQMPGVGQQISSARQPTNEQPCAALLDTLRRWGVKTLGQLAALPSDQVYERLGGQGILWQRLARGEDTSPLVPWVPEEPFACALELEWPIEGLEPLSFVLARLLEPLADRLEQADRGAAILHTHLRLVDKTTHARTLQLPAPMRDSKTLRTLLLLDLEANPPTAAIDRVRVLVEPTPGRVLQWALFERAQPSPEQVSTLLARLTALMGEGHVGSPTLVDSWKPGAFAMMPFDVRVADSAQRQTPAPVRPSMHAALRRFRLPIPARVQLQGERPARIMTDRRGMATGAVVQSAGPWRTAGEWWNDAHAGRTWDRDEWDVSMTDGTIYRLFVERDSGHWFLEGVVD